VRDKIGSNKDRLRDKLRRKKVKKKRDNRDKIKSKKY
jgi:hypothetical protein